MKNIYFQKNKGFTLLEMLMVVAIFSILTSVVIYNYGEFNSRVVTTNMAYEVALTIREAQTYSLGVRKDEAGFNSSYGVFFDIEQATKSFMLFIDDESYNNDLCDSATGECDLTTCDSGSECNQIYSLMRNIQFEKICVTTNGYDPVSDDGNCDKEEIKSATVSFERPNPEPIFTDASISPITNIKNMGIVITSPGGFKRAVIINSNGSVSIKTISD